MLESLEDLSHLFFFYLKETHIGKYTLTDPPTDPPTVPKGRQVQREAVSIVQQQWAHEETG